MIFKLIQKSKKVIRFFLRVTFFYAVLLLGTTNLLAQTYYFDDYGVQEGLPSKVYDLIQDNQGYIWLASESGITKFDGVNVRNYTSEDGLAEGGIKALLKDNKGYLWMGHKTGGISFFNGEEIKIHPISEMLNVEITSFLMDAENVLWLTTLGDGLIKIENPYSFDPEKIKYEQYKGKRLSDRVFSGTIAKGDTVFFITDAGIKKYNKAKNEFESYAPPGLTKYFQITDMLEDSKGNIWFGTFHGGLFQFVKDKNEFKIYDARDGLANNWISTILEDSQGNIWVGTWGGGITKFNDEGYYTFDNSNGLSDLKIWRILEDVEGNVLIGTNEHGLSIFKGEKFISYTVDDGLIDQNVWTVTQDKDGKYWFGTNKGLSVYNPKAGENGIKFANFNQESHAIGDQIRYLKKDNNDNIWIGTADAAVTMYNYATGRFEANPIINRFFRVNQLVTAMDIDSKNLLWIGTLEGLIYYEIDEKKSQLLTQINGLNGADISAIYVDSKDQKWVGINNGKGLNVIENDYNIVKIELEGLITPKSIVEDKNGLIYIGTQTKGIIVLKDQKVVKAITEDDGLLSNLVYQLNVDEFNNVYAGTSRGLNKIDPNGNIHVYTERSGFTGIEAKENATYKDYDGNLWFGTVKGVTKYQPKLDTDLIPEPITHIAGLQVNRKDRDLIANQT